ncbi:MAG: S4 domain-containing protein [Mariprofundaceae bacterium]|nr:S4 domain-containing protein [Mariprofundaceae bacterium]
MSESSIRIDKWLWAARFYKMRSMAADAVRGGHVWINGSRAKPSKHVHLDDAISLQKDQLTINLLVIGLAGKRGSATVAQGLFEETAESIERRAVLAEQHKLHAASSPAPDKRPDKRDRRHIISFKSK